MLSSKNNFTIVIVTFKSEKVIETCLNSIDQKYTVIIVENSRDASFKKNIFFDENIFMYLENNDLCKRTIENNENVYIIPKSQIVHFGAKAVSN